MKGNLALFLTNSLPLPLSPLFFFSLLSFSSAHALTTSFVNPVTRPVAPADSGLVVIAVDGGR